MNYILKHTYDDSNVSYIEQIKLQRILNMYNLNIVNVEKVRSVYKVYTDDELFCLKEVSSNKRKAMKGIKIMEHLKNQGFKNIANPHRCSLGSYLVQTKDSAYYLTDWIDASEVKFTNKGHILESSKLLATFHKHAKGFKADGIKITNQMGKWPSIFSNKIDFLNNIKEKLLLDQDVEDFDIIYRDNIDYFINEAQFSLHMLKHSEYESICKHYSKEQQICHNSFYYQNILVDKNHKYYLIDLESCIYDFPFRDIGKLIMRILDKKENLWDFELCKDILEAYSSIRTIEQNEYKVVLPLIIFPYKFYKIGQKKYVKEKKWKNKRFYRKLERIIESKEKKKEFINKFINYYNIKI